MQYVSIKKSVKDGREVFLVPALNLKNSEGTTKQRIAHPLGDDYLEFQTLEEAIRAAELSGFKYILPDGTKQAETVKIQTSNNNIDEAVYNTLLNQIRDINPAVSAAAITALGEFGDAKLIDLFIEKMGEDNDAIRTSAINSVLNFGEPAVEKLLTALKSGNWVKRNSALIALSRLIDSETVNPEKLFSALIEAVEDKNTIVKTTAVTTLGKAYKLYKKEV